MGCLSRGSGTRGPTTNPEPWDLLTFRGISMVLKMEKCWKLMQDSECMIKPSAGKKSARYDFYFTASRVDFIFKINLATRQASSGLQERGHAHTLWVASVARFSHRLKKNIKTQISSKSLLWTNKLEIRLNVRCSCYTVTVLGNNTTWSMIINPL